MIVVQRIPQDLREVEGLDRTVLAFGETGKMHEATHVTGDEVVGLNRFDVLQLQFAHGGGDIGKADGKRATEAAALLGLAEGDDLGVFD